jgi:hypothetical protein
MNAGQEVSPGYEDGEQQFEMSRNINPQAFRKGSSF